MKVKIQEITVKEINIDGDVFTLKCYGDKSNGKLTVEIAYGSSFSYGWCYMSCNLEEFLLSANTSYIKEKLKACEVIFSPSNTLKEIRKHLKKELPYYNFMEIQKEFREELKELESCEDSTAFHYELMRIVENIIENFKKP